MRTLTVTSVVCPNHTLTLQIPEDIPPGTYQVVLVLQEKTALCQPGDRFTANWTAHQTGPAEPNTTYRREDIYGDDGR